jgi:hypothetical protein
MVSRNLGPDEADLVSCGGHFDTGKRSMSLLRSNDGALVDTKLTQVGVRVLALCAFDTPGSTRMPTLREASFVLAELGN